MDNVIDFSKWQNEDIKQFEKHIEALIKLNQSNLLTIINKTNDLDEFMQSMEACSQGIMGGYFSQMAEITLDDLLENIINGNFYLFTQHVKGMVLETPKIKVAIEMKEWK
ncbi:hypothetical protein F9U64_16285 [Gracilibacillus oryzae]|uniref:Uncharacterized protein n=1 Tax=Gracilibacillus oryzae TaxID=1672701 RepID=A0A7C8KTI8_9BACI|nr:hypothetical protein [Gracilibacillus oryzae]KAB8128489.1 hypothetical protein F9U64_16285 [Gracilibacillus oryzae]